MKANRRELLATVDGKAASAKLHGRNSETRNSETRIRYEMENENENEYGYSYGYPYGCEGNMQGWSKKRARPSSESSQHPATVIADSLSSLMSPNSSKTTMTAKRPEKSVRNLKKATAMGLIGDSCNNSSWKRESDWKVTPLFCSASEEVGKQGLGSIGDSYDHSFRKRASEGVMMTPFCSGIEEDKKRGPGPNGDLYDSSFWKRASEGRMMTHFRSAIEEGENQGLGLNRDSYDSSFRKRASEGKIAPFRSVIEEDEKQGSGSIGDSYDNLIRKRALECKLTPFCSATEEGGEKQGLGLNGDSYDSLFRKRVSEGKIAPFHSAIEDDEKRGMGSIGDSYDNLFRKRASEGIIAPFCPAIEEDETQISCPDYEELGYCLKGDSCPMKHGSDRIVCESLDTPILPALFNTCPPPKWPLEGQSFPKAKQKMKNANDSVSGGSVGGNASQEEYTLTSSMGAEKEEVRSSSKLDENCISDSEDSIRGLSCPDYEQGYCLKGDSCPLAHGPDKIVVKDLQSLVELRLPLSLVGNHEVTTTGGSVAELSSRVSQSGLSSAAIGIEAYTTQSSHVPPMHACKQGGGSGTTEVDVYDPDEPYWREDGDGNLDMLKGQSVSIHGDDHNGESPLVYCQTSSFAASVDGEKSEIDGIAGLQHSRKKDTRVDDAVESISENMDSFQHRSIDIASSSYRGGVESSKKKKEEEEEEGGGSVVGLSEAPKSKQAKSSLYISSIPTPINHKELLSRHFQKFGKIVDIRMIPKIGSAFVQFSKREDAEHALKSQEAVMGNRFIRISWANRDNIQDLNEADSSSLPRNGQSQTAGQSTVKHSTKIRAPIEKAGKAAVSVNGKLQASSPSYSVAKKKEEIELMKEEIQRKQMELAKKCDDFRNSLRSKP